MHRRFKTLSLLSVLLFAQLELYRAAQEQTDLLPEGVQLNKDEKPPFRNPKMETIGSILMFILIALSNAGGLSGAGSNIPIMLIFFDLEMHEAVPISAFVAVCATVFRFLLNFNQPHPLKQERKAINYEVVELTMPFVFLGSFFGVQLGHIVGETAQVCIFAITVAWSITTTTKKACKLVEEERQKEEQMEGGDKIEGGMEICMEGGDGFVNTGTEHDLEMIKHQESHHFTCNRVFFMLVNFLLLMINNAVFKMPGFSDTQKKICVVGFTVAMIAMTWYGVKRVKRIHEIKEAQGYEFDPQDMRFETTEKVVKLAIYCMIAAILCGMTGIAGGMVLGPLFLTYNMVPQVMSGTNQYITMVASIAVVLQFIYLDQLYWGYSMEFGVITIFAAFTGIQAINSYVKKSGKQSVIAILLVIVLTLALVSLPLKFLVLGNKDAAASKIDLSPSMDQLQLNERQMKVDNIRSEVQMLLAGDFELENTQLGVQGLAMV